jgi:hypothetical protein
MTTITFNEMAPTVAARVEGCPHGMIIEALRDASIEFCTKTRTHTIAQQLTLDGTEQPDFGLDEQVLDIIDASIGGKRENVCISYANDPSDEDELEAGKYRIRFVDANNFEILPAPTVLAPITIDLMVCVAPGPTANGVHIDLWRRHHKALRNGALASLLDESGKPWANETAAAKRLKSFEDAITKEAGYAGRNRTQPARRLRVKSI